VAVNQHTVAERLKAVNRSLEGPGARPLWMHPAGLDAFGIRSHHPNRGQPGSVGLAPCSGVIQPFFQGLHGFLPFLYPHLPGAFRLRMPKLPSSTGCRSWSSLNHQRRCPGNMQPGDASMVPEKRCKNSPSNNGLCVARPRPHVWTAAGGTALTASVFTAGTPMTVSQGGRRGSISGNFQLVPPESVPPR
jgi:hypothetical protein